MPANLTGMQALMRQLQQMNREVDQSLKEKALKAGGEVYVEGIKNEITSKGLIKSHRWIDSIIVSDVEDGTVAIGSEVGKKAFYDYFHEIGTSKMPARPVYGPVYLNKMGEVEREMIHVIKRELGLGV